MLHEKVKMMQEMYQQKSYPLTPPWVNPELSIQVLGIFESSGRFQWSQVVPRHCLHIIQSGAGIFNADGKEFAVKKDQIFTFFPGQYIEYHDFPATPWKYTWINFEGSLVDRAFSDIGITKKNPLVDSADNLKFKSVLLPVINHIITNSFHKLFPVVAAWELLSALAAIPSSQTATDNQQLFEEGKILIDSQLDNNLTVDDLADRLEVNRSTLFRAFKTHGDLSPKEYIDNCRFERAKELLIRSNMPISRIAHACGFTEHHYFTNAFRKRFSMTPGEFRKKVK